MHIQNEPAPEVLVFITYGQMPLINGHADLSHRASGLNFDLNIYLYPYFVYTSSEGSGESAHMGEAQTSEPSISTTEHSTTEHSTTEPMHSS